MKDKTVHPGLMHFYSESIFYAVDGICAFIAALMNVVAFESTYICSFLFIVIGGLIQFLISLRSFRARDHFGGSAFAIFSSLWFLIGLELLNKNELNYHSRQSPFALILAIFSTTVARLDISHFLPACNVFILTAISIPVGQEAMVRYLKESNHVPWMSTWSGTVCPCYCRGLWMRRRDLAWDSRKANFAWV